MVIISLLAGLLLPALQSAMEVARQTVCANNQRQIGLAFTAYAGDYAGYMPAYKLMSGGKGVFDYTREIIQNNYLQSDPRPINATSSAKRTAAVCVCPTGVSTSLEALEAGGDSESTAYYRIYRYGNYAYNGYYANGNAGFVPLKLNRVQQPSQCSFLCDGKVGDLLIMKPAITYPHGANRSLKTANVIYFDFHIERLDEFEINNADNVFFYGHN